MSVSPSKSFTKKSQNVLPNGSTLSATKCSHWFEAPVPNLDDAKMAAIFKKLLETESDYEKIVREQVADPSTLPPISKLFALDCEMVEVASVVVLTPEEEEMRGIAPEKRGQPRTLLQSQLARVSIVDSYGNVVLDSYVVPDDPIVDYRTQWSGVTKEKLEGAPSFAEISEKFNRLLPADAILVGQSIDNDLKVMKLNIPMNRIRDTALFYQRFHPRSRTFGLKHLVKWCLGITIQDGQHDSVIDARSALLIYRQIRHLWERTVPVHDPYPVNFLDPRPPPIPIDSDLPEGFKRAVEEMGAQYLASHSLSFKPGQPVPPVPQAATFAPQLHGNAGFQMHLLPAKPIPFQPAFSFAQPLHYNIPAAIPAATSNLIATDKTISKTAEPIPEPEDECEESATLSFLSYPILKPHSAEKSLTSSQIIKAFYSPQIQSELIRAEKVGLLRLAGAPYWLVPNRTLIDQDLHQVSVEAVLEKIDVKVDTSAPGAKALKRKRKLEDLDGDDVPPIENGGERPQKEADEKPLITGKMKRSMEWVAKLEAKQKLKKQREYAKKKVKKAELVAKLRDAGINAGQPVIRSAVGAVKEFLKSVNGNAIVSSLPVADVPVENKSDTPKSESTIVKKTLPKEEVAVEIGIGRIKTQNQSAEKVEDVLARPRKSKKSAKEVPEFHQEEAQEAIQKKKKSSKITAAVAEVADAKPRKSKRISKEQEKCEKLAENTPKKRKSTLESWGENDLPKSKKFKNSETETGSKTDNEKLDDATVKSKKKKSRKSVADVEVPDDEFAKKVKKSKKKKEAEAVELVKDEPQKVKKSKKIKGTETAEFVKDKPRKAKKSVDDASVKEIKKKSKKSKKD